MEWLQRPLVCAGVAVAEPLDPARLVDSDLRGICLRMHAILETIEMSRCEGRLIPVALFDAIDTLESMVLHSHRSPAGHSRPPRLAEWLGVIRDFGDIISWLATVRSPLIQPFTTGLRRDTRERSRPSQELQQTGHSIDVYSQLSVAPA
jgi:hypothetical protein